VGFFDSILGMFGIGQPKLTASASETSLKRGAIVTVNIRLEGGKRDIPLTALVAAFKVESKLKDGQSTWDTLVEEKIYFGKQIVQTGDVVEGTVSLQIPADCDTTGGLRHFIEASADVPGWDPEQEIDVKILAQNDPMAAEDASRYHVLPAERSFRNSSVRGDFRVFPLADGGAALGWKTSLICRNADGSERWRTGFGRTATVSPNGDKIAAANQSKQVGIIDVKTGSIDTVIDINDYVNNIVWTSEGLACNVTEKIIVVSLQGDVVREITSLGGDGEPFIGGLAGKGDTLYAIDANDRLLVEVDSCSGEISASKSLSFYPSDVYQHGDTTVLDCNETIVMGQGTSLGKGFDVPGREGIRFLGQTEHSYTHFKPNGRLSPDQQHFLLNDQSGLLWLLDAKGRPQRTWSRETLDFVEDTGWLDNETFVAITNDGRSHMVNAVTGAISWSQQDL